MKKLDVPQFDFRTTYSTCVDGVGIAKLAERLEDCCDDLEDLAEDYIRQARAGNLYTINALPRIRGADPIVVCAIKKSELVHLYEYYLLHESKPARKIYDKIRVAAAGKCPFCGGIGTPKTLDHYLPKSFFPQFSVLPANLIPSCRDCNMDGKGVAFATNASDQILHPYLDANHFFLQKWVSASVLEDRECAIEYFPDPPVVWSAIDKSRVEKHFEDFELADRYSVEASEELSIVIDQRKGFMRDFSPQDFSQYLGSVAQSSLFINHWKRVMYHALMNSNWFCNEQF